MVRFVLLVVLYLPLSLPGECMVREGQLPHAVVASWIGIMSYEEGL